MLAPLALATILTTPVAAPQDYEGGPFGWLKSSWWIRRQMAAHWVLSGARVVDVASGTLSEPVHIAVKGDEIVSVGPDEPNERWTVVDAEGLYVIPGLFDLHAHVIPPSQFFESAPPGETLRLLVEHGVTTIRCLPLFSESALVWGARVHGDELVGPSIVPASGIFEKEPQRTSQGFGDAETARRWVLKEASMGTRWIKVYNKMDPESLRTIVDTAAAHGMKVCGHAHDVPPREAVELGMASLEHIVNLPWSCLRAGAVEPDELGLFERIAWGWEHYDAARGAELAELLRERGAAWVPTLVVSEHMARDGHDGTPIPDDETQRRLEEALAAGARAAVAFHRAGALVGVGTDFPVDGVPPGSSVHRELELLVSLGGATPAEALRMATLDSARILGLDAITGTVAAGKLADFVVLEANPLEDIANVRRIARVVTRGVRLGE